MWGCTVAGKKPPRLERGSLGCLFGSSGILHCRWEDGRSRVTVVLPRSCSNCSCRSRLRPRQWLSEERAKSWDALLCTLRWVGGIGTVTRGGWEKCWSRGPRSCGDRAVGTVWAAVLTSPRARQWAAWGRAHTSQVSLSTVRVPVLHCWDSLLHAQQARAIDQTEVIVKAFLALLPGGWGPGCWDH